MMEDNAKVTVANLAEEANNQHHPLDRLLRQDRLPIRLPHKPIWRN